MSAIEIQRARLVREFHTANGHPSDSTLKEGLDNNVWPSVDFTPRDVDNSNKLLGHCAGCYEGKMINPSEPSHTEPRATLPGELLYLDLLKSYSRCIGGHTQALVCRDYVSSFIHVIGMNDKTNQSILQATLSIIAYYLSYGHTVKVLVFDHEQTFLAMEHKIPGVRVQYTPAGVKNKHVERAIREIREKDRCTRANLPYQLPACLEIESWIAQAESINALPNTATGPNHTAHQLVTGLRPLARPIAFGKAVLTYARSTNNPQQRTEWGVFLTQSSIHDSRVFLPGKGCIVSRRKVVEQDGYPGDFNFISRPKIIPPAYIPSVADIPESSPAAAAANPLITQNPSQPIGEPVTQTPITTSNIPQPPPQSTPIVAENTVRSQPTLMNPLGLPSITQFIPSNIPPTVTTQPQAAAPVQPARSITTQPQAAVPPPTPGPRYNLRVNPKATARYQANYNYMLPARINAFHFSYGKSNRGVPIQFRIPSSNVNLDKVKARIIAYRISMRQALKDPDPVRATAGKKALEEEIAQLIDSGTFDPKPYASLSQEQRRRVIPSHMFFKDKYFADGKFQKLKARLVAGGNFVDTSLVGDISSWTVNPITVMLMLNLAAMNTMKILTIDVKGAFLIPELTDSPTDLTYVTIDKTLSDEITKLKPEWKSRINPNGTYTMQLKKTLYGLGISSNRWMTHLNTTLLKLGFSVSPGDRCCFTKGDGESRLFICSHVDDILCVGKPDGIKLFKTQFEKEYEINVQEGQKHSYIGLDIMQQLGTHRVSIGQTGYRRDVLNRFAQLMHNNRADGKVPCGTDIVEPIPMNSEEVDRSLYMSIIMSVMFLSRFTRPDLAFAVSILSTHCTNPKRHHMKQAIKLLHYIAHSPDMAIVFETIGPSPTVYADASHATHHDGYGHGCLVIKIGSGMIYCRSYKLKLITLSSTESEHVVLCDAATLSEWLLSMLGYFRFKNKFIRVYQDNTSAIWLSENEGNFARNKHLLIRRNKAREAVLNGTIDITYTPTEAMIADLGTKPLSLRMLLKHMSNIGMMIITRPHDIYTLSRIVVPAARPNRRPDTAPSAPPKGPKGAAPATTIRVPKGQVAPPLLVARKSATAAGRKPTPATNAMTAMRPHDNYGKNKTAWIPPTTTTTDS